MSLWNWPNGWVECTRFTADLHHQFARQKPVSENPTYEDLAAACGRSTLGAMRRAMQLSVRVGEAAFIGFAGSTALILGTAGLGLNLDQKSIGADLALVAMAFLPSIGAAFWLSRKLQTMYSRREASAASIAFGVLSPIFLSVSMVLGEISGGYAESLAGRPIFGAIGAFAGAFVVTAFLSLVVCALVLRVTRLTIDVEENESSTLPH